MAKRVRDSVTLALVVASTVAGTAACGDDAPSQTPRSDAGNGSPSVATVAGQRVSRRDFDHWLAVFARLRAPGGARTAPIPDPPRFAACVATLQRQPAPGGAAPPTRRRLRRACAVGYERLKRQTLEFLIQAKWVEQRAREEGIVLDDDQLSARFERETGDVFPDDEQRERFLARSGRTLDDALYQLRLTELQARLIRRLKQRIEVTDEDVARYYRARRSELGGLPLAAVEERVRRAIRARREEQALSGFTGGVARALRAKTSCAPGYVVAQCGGRQVD